MEVPIILYGSTVLRKHSDEVTEEDNIQEIGIALFETLIRGQHISIMNHKIIEP